MKRIALLFLFLSLSTQNSFANPVYSASSTVSGLYAAPEFTTPNSNLAYTATNSVAGTRLRPLGNAEDYLVVMKGGLATLDLNAVTSFSFLWGSPDPLNAFSLITSLGTYSFSGTDLHSLFNVAYGKNTSTTLFTINSLAGELLESISFSSGSNSFELAVPHSIPEPQTWVLLLLGIALMAYQMRKRPPTSIPPAFKNLPKERYCGIR